MIVTDMLSKINFSAIPTTMPATWYLGDFIPGGVLDVTQLQVRLRVVNKYWQQWGPVDAWNADTKTATYFRPIVASQIEFRRVTPRYAAYLDPLARKSRVSQKNLQTNADQGVFVAVETAADLGINAKAVLLPDPGDGPNSLKLIQRTQNYWGPNVDYTQKSWNFHFSGGYLDKSHVQAQVLLSTGWTLLTIDPSENDPLAPSNAPFRFIGDYQLFMDFSTLSEGPQGMVIFRHTPRNINVSSPEDAAKITALGMDPSARQAFFVAVEIGEQISKREPICECPSQFYTSALYPIIFSDKMGYQLPVVNLARLTNGILDNMQYSLPAITGGMLSSVLVTYTNWRDVVPESMQYTLPTITGGSLAVTLVSYLNWRDVVPEQMQYTLPTITGGSLAVILISYLNWRDAVPESMQYTLPSITAGSLT